MTGKIVVKYCHSILIIFQICNSIPFCSVNQVFPDCAARSLGLPCDGILKRILPKFQFADKKSFAQNEYCNITVFILGSFPGLGSQ
jgi:hypothetical protein